MDSTHILSVFGRAQARAAHSTFHCVFKMLCVVYKRPILLLQKAFALSVGNPQLREDLQSSSEQYQEEKIAEWVDRVLEQRTDWPWDWGLREQEPAWEDDYQFPE